MRFKEMISAAASVAGTGPDEGVRLSFESIRTRNRGDDPSKPLIERLGGELVLETLVELSYMRFIDDSRLRAFFDLNPRKSALVKKRLLQFLIGFLDGKSSYDESNLKPSHYHLNITDYHLDAFLDTFRSVLQVDLKVAPGAVQDLIAALSKVRKDIVTGYTIRSELARINTAQGMEVLFHKLGGLEGLVRFIDRLYDVIAIDARIRKFFTGSSIEKIKNGQRAYITQLIGGPLLYRGPSMEEIHKNLNIDDYYFDCFVQDAEKALSWLGADESVTDQVLIQLESVRASVVGRRRGVDQIIAQQADVFTTHLSGGTLGSQAERFLSNTDSVASTGTASLLVMLGGDKKLTEAVDVLFNGSLGDPRLRFFFQIIQKREKSVKRAFANVLVTVAGGMVLYDLTQLKSAHFGFNITDYHFDTLLANLCDACRLLDMAPAGVAELAARLSKLRSEITRGCTIRLEMAQQRTETRSGRTLCSALGGAEGVKRVIAKLYELVLHDVRILGFFQGTKLETIMRSQGQYLANLFGANEAYTGRDIRKVHTYLNVADFHFDCFLENIAKAVTECGFSPETADECTVLAETTRRDIVNTATKSYSITSQRTLLEALGGYPGVEAVTKTLMATILSAESSSHPAIILKHIFQHAAVDRLVHLERKLIKFIEVLAAGPMPPAGVTSELRKDLAEAHSRFNITDAHFDAFVELIGETMRIRPGVLPEDIAEFVQVCKAFRGFVTKGFRLRREALLVHAVAQRSLHSRLGRGVHDVVSEALVTARLDQRIAAVLSMDGVETGIATTLENALMGAAGEPAAHTIGLNHYQFDVLGEHVVGACAPEVKAEVSILVMEPLRDGLVNAGQRRKASLFARIGGEVMIEQLVDVATERLMDSPTEPSPHEVRVFFDFPKSRIRSFKRRITRFLAGLFGGPSIPAPRIQAFDSNLSGTSVASVNHETGGDSSYIRNVHAGFNIRDVHFDAFVRSFAEAAKELGIATDVAQDVLAAMSGLRNDVVVGWNVRENASIHRIELTRNGEHESLYSQLGGFSNDPGLENLMARMYELVERDRRINEFFTGSKFAAIRRTQGAVIVSLLGGPLATSRPPVDVHRIFNISNYHFDCFMKDLIQAARDCGAQAEQLDDIVVVLEPFRQGVTCGSRKNFFISS